MYDVLIIGGGNAGLCAALKAREAGAKTLLLEASPKEWRGGNSQHTRNLRCMHDAPQDVLIDVYSEDEYWSDVQKVTAGHTNEKLARLVIRTSSVCRDWMRKYGVNFQPPLSGALHVARTNAFFMGGGKALVNAYYRSAQNLGVDILYNAKVTKLDIVNNEFKAAYVGETRYEARACVLAAGGFESNLEWIKEAWGKDEEGNYPAENFIIRGTKFNNGDLLKIMMKEGADIIGDPSQSHCVAVDARAPLYDGGICTRIDCVSLGIVVNNSGKRFYDEGEDFWPKRYAIWGRLVAKQANQIAYSIIDSQSIGLFMPPVFDGVEANSIEELAKKLKLNTVQLQETISLYNRACHSGTFDHSKLDDCFTEGITPPKTHWARPIDSPPFYAFALKPGITFTYLGLKIAEDAAVRFANVPSKNLFVAGEMMAGNILGMGYTAGIGMSIGTTFGMIAGEKAAQAALSFFQEEHKGDKS